MRPNLGTLIRIFLKLIDEIDFDELIDALRKIVEVFESEIGPYAIQLCQKLGEAYERMFKATASMNAEKELEEDAETSLTACGLMTAIRRIMESISGMCSELYPQIEGIICAPILMTI
jgi:hypothetical protein